MLERFAFQDSDKGPIGWLFIAFLVLGSAYLGISGVVGLRRKVTDREWRQSADKWERLKLGFVSVGFFAATSITLFAGLATAIVWLRK